MGAVRAGTEDAGGRHHLAAAHPRRLRASRARDRSGKARGAAHLRHRRAGPTGVEMAGTIADMARDTLPPDFRNIDTRKARVVLIEAGPRVLAGFPEDLSAYAQRSLEKLGVEVMLGEAVTECSIEGVVYGGKRLAAR